MIPGHLIDAVVARALEEDIGSGDVTTLSIIGDETAAGRFIAKEEGVVCGLPVARRVFAALDSSVRFEARAPEGGRVREGGEIAAVYGPAASILMGERVALNFLQRLSGIATGTRRAVEAVSGTRAVIADTRKTTPLLRAFEKYAVRTGGGVNHRFNLSDGILIKDNHIRAAGGIASAVRKARQNAPHTLKIEVEAENLEQVEEALRAGADIIMLDNMAIDDMAEAVRRIGGRAQVEASGNMGERDLRSVALAGVDIISIGALTHTVRALDISLRFDQ